MIFGSDKWKAATKTLNPASSPSEPRVPSVVTWGGREQQTLLQLFSKSLALQAVVSMLHLEHVRYFIILAILKGTQFGSTAWSGGVRASVWGSALHGGMLPSSLLALAFFQVSYVVPSSLLVISTEKSAKGLLGTGLVQSGLWSVKMDLSLRAASESHLLSDQPLCDAS